MKKRGVSSNPGFFLELHQVSPVFKSYRSTHFPSGKGRVPNARLPAKNVFRDNGGEIRPFLFQGLISSDSTWFFLVCDVFLILLFSDLFLLLVNSCMGFLIPFVCIIVRDDGIFASKSHMAIVFVKKKLVPFKPFQSTKRKQKLGGGNSNIFYVHPYLGKMNPFGLIFFRWVGSTTNQKRCKAPPPARGADFRLYDGLLSSFLGDLVDGNSDLFFVGDFLRIWDFMGFITVLHRTIW